MICGENWPLMCASRRLLSAIWPVPQRLTMSEKGATRSSGADAGSHFDEVVRLLSDATSYPEHRTQVLLRETHISCVFLTDHYAYKLKKPVAFEFVDFRTVEA